MLWLFFRASYPQSGNIFFRDGEYSLALAGHLYRERLFYKKRDLYGTHRFWNNQQDRPRSPESTEEALDGHSDFCNYIWAAVAEIGSRMSVNHPRMMQSAQPCTVANYS